MPCRKYLSFWPVQDSSLIVLDPMAMQAAAAAAGVALASWYHTGGLSSKEGLQAVAAL